MFEKIFIFDSVPPSAIQGNYNLLLVIISYIVASFASYVALDFAGHLASTKQQSVSKRTIHFFGAFAMGAGIWSMHFIGMLAYQTKMSMSYDPFITFLSMLVAVAISYFVLEIVKAERLTIRSIIVGAVLLGFGICAMHYSGMMAMNMDADLRYTPGLFALSVAIAIGASAAALLIAFTLARHRGKYQVLLKIASALIMGAAICGMHYTGVAASVFLPYADCRYDPDKSYMGMALSIGIITMIILGTALFFGAELNKQHKQSLLEKFVHYLFYKKTILFVVVMAIMGGVLVFFQIWDTQTKLESEINAFLTGADIGKVKGIIVEAMDELSMMIFSITIAATAFIAFIIHLVRKREIEIASAKRELENQLQEKERIGIQLNAYIERMEETNYEMLQAKMLAEKASQSKSDFLANMSHEIRTPMNGVLGMVGLILDTNLNPEQRGWAEIIKKSGENLLDIINDILDFSKIEAGKLELEPIPFNISDAVEEVTDVLRLRTQEKGIEMLVRFDPATPKFVIGDSGRLRQILINLIGNAIKFTENGHVLIDVRGTCEDGKAHLFFEVQDTGIGIPEDKVSYIFQKFSQAEESTTRKFGGTGLGLTISKSLVEMMGGSIGVRSVTGSGSSFILILSCH